VSAAASTRETSPIRRSVLLRSSGPRGQTRGAAPRSGVTAGFTWGAVEPAIRRRAGQQRGRGGEYERAVDRERTRRAEYPGKRAHLDMTDWSRADAEHPHAARAAALALGFDKVDECVKLDVDAKTWSDSGGGTGKLDSNDWQSLCDTYGDRGWELVSLVTTPALRELVFKKRVGSAGTSPSGRHVRLI
jgi:hypothetical protein